VSRKALGSRLVQLLLVGTLAVARPADAAPRRPAVSWTEIGIRPGDDAQRLTKLFEKRIKAASKRAEWKAKPKKPPSDALPLSKPDPAGAPLMKSEPKPPAELVAKVVRFAWTAGKEVLHLDVEALGRMKAGPTVKTRIRLSGRPEERSNLEKDALRIVADGIVMRLAEIVRRKR